MYQQFKNANGITIQSTISSLRDVKLDDYDVVINCMGLGAREAVPDPKMMPIRGQIARVSDKFSRNVLFFTQLSTLF